MISTTGNSTSNPVKSVQPSTKDRVNTTDRVFTRSGKDESHRSIVEAINLFGIEYKAAQKAYSESSSLHINKEIYDYQTFTVPGPATASKSEVIFTYDPKTKETYAYSTAPKQLGAGGFKTVSVALKFLAGKQAALVRINPDSTSKSADKAFRKEIKIIDQLASRNIKGAVKNHAVISNNIEGKKQFIQELGHESLSKKIKNKDLGFPEKRKIVVDLLKGLAEIHEAGFLHRDIKPDNIMSFQNPDGTISWKYIDFGLACTQKRDDPDKYIRCGTKCFMAPEYIDIKDPIQIAKATKPSLDVFALGLTFSELYEITEPDELDEESLNYMFEREDELRDTDPDILEIINGMCEENPTKRMTISEALQLLGEDYK